MNIKRTARFSIASVLLAMTIVALVGRTSLDHVRLAQLSQDLALHDSVEHQRSIVAQRQIQLAALRSQLPSETNVQFRNRWVLPGASNNDEQVTRIAITPIRLGYAFSWRDFAPRNCN